MPTVTAGDGRYAGRKILLYGYLHMTEGYGNKYQLNVYADTMLTLPRTVAHDNILSRGSHGH